MGAYLDRLNAQFDEIRAGIDTLVNRAAEENRDVNDDEQKQVDRDKARMAELEKAIEHYSGIEKSAEKVTTLRATIPAPRQTATVPAKAEAEYDVAREFPTPGDYAAVVNRAGQGDPEAAEMLNRATAHQKTTDNPGLIPRPILGPVVNLIDSNRPFVNSCTRRGLPAGSFDRPVVTQHVAVDEQVAEKDLTASRQMTIGKMPVDATTFAGHLNISRQNVKWTQPGILNIIFDDFAAVYAIRTCDFAVASFMASITNAPVTIGGPTGAEVTEALYGAAADIFSATGSLPDTLYAAPDVWGSLGGMSNQIGMPAFPSLSIESTAGNPLGLTLVVDAHFPAGTLILGSAARNEWYEDVDGLLQVQEPDVLGQLVGYAGFAAYLNTVPAAFTPLTMPAAGP
jgi:hypothetical protein